CALSEPSMPTMIVWDMSEPLSGEPVSWMRPVYGSRCETAWEAAQTDSTRMFATCSAGDLPGVPPAVSGPVSKEIMKDQIDVAVRRSPKYSVFMGIGAVLGVFVAGILAMFVDHADMPMGYTFATAGGLLAVILDWTGRKRAKEFRVDAQIDMVDDPKEVARRRLAEARGEDPDADETEAVDESAAADTDPGPAEGAETIDDAAEDGGA